MKLRFLAVATLILSSASPAFAAAGSHLGEQRASEVSGVASNCYQKNATLQQSSDQAIRQADQAQGKGASAT